MCFYGRPKGGDRKGMCFYGRPKGGTAKECVTAFFFGVTANKFFITAF